MKEFDKFFKNDGMYWNARKTLTYNSLYNFIVGMRQDITYKWLDQAVISDDNGKVILNLAQQDCVALRVVMRVGFQVANPINRIEPTAANRYPAVVLSPKA